MKIEELEYKVRELEKQNKIQVKQIIFLFESLECVLQHLISED